MMDICLCATEDCPKYKECLRGDGGVRPPGVYTMSFLGEVCNEKNNYADFIPQEQ